MKLQILNGKQTQNDYPYGRLRCTRYSSIEFKKNKGFRRVDQTINPKTNRINNPKKSTYYKYITLYKEENTDYVKGKFFDINGFSNIQSFKEFLNDNYDQLDFTAEQSEYLWNSIMISIKVSVGFIKFKTEKDLNETLNKFLEEIKYKEIIQLFNNGNSIKEFAKLNFNLTEVLKKYEDKNGETMVNYKKR
jgi:hypothetical protein